MQVNVSRVTVECCALGGTPKLFYIINYLSLLYVCFCNLHIV